MTDAVWTLSETFQGKIKPVSYELLSWGRQLADDLNVELVAVVLGADIPDSELQTLIHHGADVVRVANDHGLAHFLVRPYARTLSYLVEQHQPQIFLAAATTTGRTVMPYLSMLVDGGLTADCTGLEIDPETNLLLQTRPAIGGNIMATIKTPTARPQMATVRPKSRKAIPADTNHKGSVYMEEIPPGLLDTSVEQVDFLLDEADASIETAEVIVAGGRAMKSIENFVLLQQLANRLHGTIAASRVPVDFGWQPYPRQVGLSGKTISPRLYIACGISGAIQHLAGIQTAENIIAINKDPDAQIFQVADLGIVGDLFEILPMILENAPIQPKE
ncbi:MAG: electron transfer flavoprotein subunit alpha/FixB family protein [Anaerolineae bacterium]|jgi:electron transfer flavoprotein alpha subunit|nr:electron transfer flavoprotein subunit alpha/FixB family protein [Anaerolineae bacterium]